MKVMTRLFLLLFLLLPAIALADIAGKVVGVSDGDTVTLLADGNRQVKIRLAEVDAPESSQPYGAKAKQVLSDLVFGKQVLAKVQTVDRYGRSVAHLYVGDTWVNRELVAGGHVWVYRQYSTSTELAYLEAEAKGASKGLWALQEDQRIPPWDYRRAKRQGGTSTRVSAPAPAPAASPSSSGYSCSGKVYCREMTSCAEARFYLEQCGLSRLDGDSDGVPCEKLCR